MFTLFYSVFHSDSEMEIEAEHYTNGVVEGSSARIMNGTYKHEEILQPDENSIGNGVTGAHENAHTHITFLFVASHLLFFSFPGLLIMLCFSSCPLCISAVCRVCILYATCLSADEGCSNSRQLCGGNQAATERMIQFGRELQALNEQLCREYGKNATHKKMLQVHSYTQSLSVANRRATTHDMSAKGWRAGGFLLLASVRILELIPCGPCRITSDLWWRVQVISVLNVKCYI